MKLDLAALSLSSLCLIHCLALPLMVSFAPLLGPISEEWVHQILVVLALPIAILAYFQTHDARTRGVFASLAGAGAVFLLVGAFYEPWHDYEVMLTVSGALLLAAGHLFRWQSHGS